MFVFMISFIQIFLSMTNRKFRFWNRLNNVFWDFMPAFLGVLVALLLSNIKEKREEKQFIQKSMQEIYLDNKKNLANIRKSLNHMDKQIDTVSYYLNDSSLSVHDLILRKNDGLIILDRHTQSLEILKKSSQFVHLDYEMINLIMGLEHAEIKYQDQLQRVTTICYEHLMDRGKNEKIKLLLALQNYRIRENNYIELCDSFDRYLETQFPGITKKASEKVDS